MNILGAASLPNLLTSTIDSVASRNLEDATRARRAFEVSQRDAEKTNPAKPAGLQYNDGQTASTLYHAQTLAQQFKDFMDKTPEELMREAVLKDLGITEEELAALGPEERAKMEEKIRERFEEKIEESLREKGIDIDISASASV